MKRLYLIAATCWLSACLHAKNMDVYLYQHPLQVDRSYQSTLISVDSDLSVSMITFDTNSNLISLNTGKANSTERPPCLTDREFNSNNSELLIRLNGDSFCEVSTKLIDKVVVFHTVELNGKFVLLLKVPAVAADLVSKVNLEKVAHILISESDFYESYPQIYNQINKKNQLIIQSDNNYFQALLLSTKE